MKKIGVVPCSWPKHESDLKKLGRERFRERCGVPYRRKRIRNSTVLQQRTQKDYEKERHHSKKSLSEKKKDKNRSPDPQI